MKTLAKDLLQCLGYAIVITTAGSILFLGWFSWKATTEGFSFPGPGHLDFSAHLAGEYSVYPTSVFEVRISPQGYGEGTPIIPTVVVACATEGHYILAERQSTRKRFPEDRDNSSMELDPQTADFWILDTKEPAVFGPLTEAQFITRRRELGLSASLELKSPRSFVKDESAPAPKLTP